VRKGQRLTGMSATQSSFPSCPEVRLLPIRRLRGVDERVDTSYCEDCRRSHFHQSLHTEAINTIRPSRFCRPAPTRRPAQYWCLDGLRLGSETKTFRLVVMISPGAGASGQPLYDRLWGSGFLPTRYQGVKFRSVGDPVLYLSDPPGFVRDDRRVFLDTLSNLNQLTLTNLEIQKSRLGSLI